MAGPTLLAERQSRDEVVASLKRALDSTGIEILFPYRTLAFKQSLHTPSEDISQSGIEQQN